jgi:hypothetical protein
MGHGKGAMNEAEGPRPSNCPSAGRGMDKLEMWRTLLGDSSTPVASRVVQSFLISGILLGRACYDYQSSGLMKLI